MKDWPIGIFDSGVGGLTVYRAVKKLLPNEKIIYLGDTARIPYGTRSPSTVKRYAHQDAAFLIKYSVKMLVIACNTISSVAIESLKVAFSVPILGVIEPGAKRAASITRNGRVGVIATEATVESDAYKIAIKACQPEIDVFSQACPLFVPLAEEGWSSHHVTKLVAQEYLKPLIDQKIDTLVLGCTHYPILRNIIQEIVGKNVTLLDSGECVAAEVVDLLQQQKAFASSKNGDDLFYVTDSGKRFRRTAELFLGEELKNLTAVDIWQTDTTANVLGSLDMLTELSDIH